MVEIGCIEIFNRVETAATSTLTSIPSARCRAKRKRFTGCRRFSCRTSRGLTSAPRKLLEFIGDSPLVAHNASFDFGFLNHELGRCGRPAVCTSRWCARWCWRARVIPAPRTASMHVARGSESTARAGEARRLGRRAIAGAGLCRIDRGGRSASAWSHDPERIGHPGYGQTVTVREPRLPRPHHAAVEELERHRAFIAKLVNPLWARFA